MTSLLKTFLTLSISSLCLTDVLGQSRIRVFRERDKYNEKDYVIYATNPTGKDHHVVVVFDELVGYETTMNPPAVNIGIGRSKLFKLKRDELSSQANFQYKYYVYPGVANPKLKEVDYALPVKHGMETQVFNLTDANVTFRQKTRPNDFYGLAFKGNAGDTISAARGGRVIKVVQGKVTEGENIVFSKSKNVIEIRHNDGSVGQYNIFESGSAMVKEGEDILTGTPLALISGENYELGTHFRLLIFYLSFEYNKTMKSKDWYMYKYITPEFVTESHGAVQLSNRSIYRALLNDDLITQEMTKRERKKYLRSK